MKKQYLATPPQRTQRFTNINFYTGGLFFTVSVGTIIDSIKLSYVVDSLFKQLSGF